MPQLPAEIFKAYDIRGIVDKSLTADVVRKIGQALGTLALEAGRTRVVVGEGQIGLHGAPGSGKPGHCTGRLTLEWRP